MNVYESNQYLAEYLLFHYGSAAELGAESWGLSGEISLNFPARCGQLFQSPLRGRALDVGCAVGRSTFELARSADEVIGIDFSERFVAAARALQSLGMQHYPRLEEGARTTLLRAVVPPEIARERVSFETGDAMDLRADLGAFDAVLAANLLCRLHEPARFLARLPSLVKPGGQLVLTTPGTWREEFTPREHWLCDDQRTTLEGLRAHLEPHFVLEETRELPFLLRETARKFQLTRAQGSRWRRR